MDELKIVELYNHSSDKKTSDFWKSADTSLQIEHNYEKNIVDERWLILMEETLRYLDNILRNPNRFIINEEEIVKIELARRITVDSIKHLSKNTNFIQEIDFETGDVKPSKILNINKEESFNTYENRFIYSLIRNMRFYVDLKKRDLNLGFMDKSDKFVKYEGNSKVGKENVSINIMLKSSLKETSENAIAVRIEKLEMRMTDLMNTEIYKTIDKLRLSPVTSPIKKTNVILKNPNFQKAVILWNFLQENPDDKTTVNKGNDVLKDNPELKTMMDEAFMLNYLVSNSIDEEDNEEIKQKKTSEILINNLVQKLVVSNKNISKKQLNDIVSDQFKLIKNQTLANEKEIRDVFMLAIKEHCDNIVKLKLRGGNAKDKRK